MGGCDMDLPLAASPWLIRFRLPVLSTAGIGESVPAWARDRLWAFNWSAMLSCGLALAERRDFWLAASAVPAARVKARAAKTAAVRVACMRVSSWDWNRPGVPSPRDAPAA